MNQVEELGNGPVNKLIFKYSMPAIIGLIINAAYVMIDRAFIGNLPDHKGGLALSGIGATMPITTIVMAVAACIAFGSLAQISMALGQADKSKAKKVVGNALTISVISGLLITIFYYLFKDAIFNLIGIRPEIYGYADDFISTLMLGTIFSILSFALPVLIRGDGSPNIASLIMLTGAVFNIVLDWIFLFSFGWGIKGAAVATIISQILVMLISLLYMNRSKSIIKAKRNDFKLDKIIISGIFSVGMVPMFTQLSISISQVISNFAFQNYGGVLYIGAMATISSITMLIMMVVSGINQGIMPILSYNVAQKNSERVNKIFFNSLKFASLFLVIAWIAIQFFSSQMVSIFSTDANLRAISANGLRLYNLLLPLVAFNSMVPMILSLIEKAKFATGSNILRQLIIYPVLIMSLPLFLGNNGLWLSQPTSECLIFILNFILLKKFFVSNIK
ncbi:MATE family efflux transporter [Floricoccus penangensis]|uniref:MATE family efflux transporter n=1 Tax=Floricoccus penangensis TaxID=1859475 RepID=UPI002040FDF1|nr:MATE family efflux transporter [Floricoccus penangensis]URZ88088.1 MATE family efflux transporter [Floricoccus penangensis]